MSTVFVQVGQCGNQVGKEFYKTVSKFQDQVPTFASEDEKWRSIHIDSEAKVVNNLYSVNKKRLRKSNIITGKYGRGSNWALDAVFSMMTAFQREIFHRKIGININFINGYHGLEDETLSRTLEALRREVERCDSYCGTVVIHSLSGGTGSGLGSHLCESIKNEYPLAYILSAVIAPHVSGDSPLQHYNSVLSLGWLQRFSDAIVLFQNDEILHRLMGVNVSKRTRDSKEISLADMNSYIGDCLAGVFLPLGKDIRKTERRKSSWEAIAGGLVNTLDRYDKHGNPFVSLANLAVIRGDFNHSFPCSVKAVENKLKIGFNCVRWNPFPVDFWIGEENLIGSTDESSLTVCANTSSCLEFAQNALAKAKLMHNSRAYLHWYQRWGCDESCFVESFEALESVIEAYTTASTR